MPSRKKQKDDPWWFTPIEQQIIATEKATKRCGLHPLIIQNIFITMARNRYPTRPKRAKKSWAEPVCIEGMTYVLSCHIDEEEKLIVVKNIRVPKKN